MKKCQFSFLYSAYTYLCVFLLQVSTISKIINTRYYSMNRTNVCNAPSFMKAVLQNGNIYVTRTPGRKIRAKVVAFSSTKC